MCVRVCNSFLTGDRDILRGRVIDLPHYERANAQIDQEMGVEEVTENDNKQLFADDSADKASTERHQISQAA